MKSGFLALAAAAAALAVTAPPAAMGQSIKAYRHIILDGHRVKWGAPEPGTGAVVTYATVDAARKFPGARNCAAMGPIARLLARSDIVASVFDAELQAAFAVWSAAANVRFEPASTVAAADILIGSQAAPRGRAFTNVEYRADGGATGLRPLARALICLNPDQRWKTGFDGDLTVYDLRYTLIHEIGHAIGLDHPAIASQLMDFRYLERFRAPQKGDVQGAVALYGPSPTVTADAPTAEKPAAEKETRRLANAEPQGPDLGG